MTAPIRERANLGQRFVHPEGGFVTLDVLGGRKGITNEFRYHTLGVQILLRLSELQVV